MSRELSAVVSSMAVREAHCSLLAPPFVPTDGESLPVRVRLVACPECGATGGPRDWPIPMRPESGSDADGPVLAMLACESLTPRAVLPIVTAASRIADRPVRYVTRALAWRELSGLATAEALARLDAAERWATGAGVPSEPVLPASTRPHGRPGAGWARHRADLVPRFLSPHAVLPSWLDGHYEAERRSALLHRSEGRR